VQVDKGKGPLSFSPTNFPARGHGALRAIPYMFGREWGARMPQEDTVIYEPPRAELPYLVVTLAPTGLKVSPAKSRTEARIIAAEQISRRKQERASSA
jgi:hypothetical protein